MNKLSSVFGSGTSQSVIIPLGHEGVINYSYTLSGKVGTEEKKKGESPNGHINSFANKGRFNSFFSLNR